MATEKAARMQQAAILKEIKESLERIEAVLGSKVKPVEPIETESRDLNFPRPEPTATESSRQPATRQGRKV